MDREKQITRVLSLLDSLARESVSAARTYAIEENRALFEAMRSPGRFVRWLTGRAIKLAPERLVEINELLPELDQAVHARLIAFERNKRFGLLKPLVQRIRDLIRTADRPLVLADFGSGGMEVERQVIESLAHEKDHPLVTFVGFDASSEAGVLARRNLAARVPEGISVFQSADACARWLKEPALIPGQAVRVAFCRTSILELPQDFAHGTFDVIFHSFFQHHLDARHLRKPEESVALGGRVLEYDGFHDWLAMMVVSILGWNDPVFLAAGMVSHRRLATRDQVIARSTNSRLHFYPNGCYLREWRSTP